MKISVIIPAHNEEDEIKKCINSVLKQSYKAYEVIVVNDASTDRTEGIVNGFKRVKLINHEKARGPAGARNHGARIAKGDILFFLDADEWMLKNTLKNTIKLFKEHNPDGIVSNRRVTFPKNWTRIWAYEFSSNWCIYKGTYFSKDALSCPYIIKKKVFNKVGGFPSNTYYFEDYILIKKIHELGVKVLLTDKITVKSDMGSSFKDFYKRARNIGIGVVKSSLSGKQARILLITLFLGVSFFYPILYAGFYLAYGLLWLKRTRDLLVGLTAPLLFTVKKFISCYYLIKEMVRKY